jgi:hypothetical protein
MDDKPTTIKPIEDRLEPYERPVITMAQAAQGPYPCLTWNSLEASFWAMAEYPEDAPYDMSICVLSGFPWPYPDERWVEENPTGCPEHCVEFEIDNMGLDEMLEVPVLDDDCGAIQWLMQKGLAPFQPFRIRAKAVYEHVGSYEYPDEWDSWVEWEIVERRPLCEDGCHPPMAWLHWAEKAGDVPWVK